MLAARRLAALLITLSCTASAAALAGDPGAWSSPGGDLGNSRFSRLDAIDAATVGRLGGAWAAPLGAPSRSAPVVRDGRMFVATVAGEVVALDAASGAVLWRAKPEGGITGANRGVTAGRSTVVVGTADGHLAALDQKTGAPVWRVLIADDKSDQAQFIASPPAAAAGLIITGLASGDRGIRGRVVALDEATGREAWRFYTVPKPGEVGGDSWPEGKEFWKRGGAAVWSTPAVDEELGLVIFGTSNAWPTFGPEVRPGDNLFTGSVVAVDLKTGTYRWHFQTVRHDMWEGDLGAPILLYDTVRDGKPVKGAAALRGDGHVFLLDRATGTPLTPVEQRPVKQNKRLATAPTQPFPAGADRVGPACAEPDMLPRGFVGACYYDPVDHDQPNVIFPTNTRFAPMAFDPASNLLFVAGGAGGFWLRRAPDPYFFVVPGPTPGRRTYGLLAALDARTNKIVWQEKREHYLPFGPGLTATAGGLVFTGEPDGVMSAREARTGKPLWQFQTGAPVAGPIATYALGGVQYVAAVSGATLWAFALDGKLPPAPAAPPPATEVEFAGRIVAADKVTLSAEIPSAVDKATFYDEHAVRPTRIRVKAGTTVTWTNAGKEAHGIEAADGSWSTGPLQPGRSATHRFDTPGRYTYWCKDHPFAVGQVIVE